MLSPDKRSILTTGIASGLVQFQVTSVSVALADVGSALGADVSALQWVVVAYALTFAVFLVFAGITGDWLGPSRACAVGYVVFAAGAIFCAAAADPLMLNLSRGLQGFGAALLIPNSLAVLRTCPEIGEDRVSHLVAQWYGIGAAAFAAGPLLGGFLVSTLGWRSVFLLNIPFCLGGFILILRSGGAVSICQHGGPKSWLSYVLLLVASASVMLVGLTFKLCTDSYLLVLLAIFQAVILCTLFHRVDARRTSPLFPISQFRTRSFSFILVFAVLIQASFSGTLFVLSLYMQRILGFGALQAGLAFLPLTATFILSNLVSGELTKLFGIRPAMISGALLASAGYVGLTIVGPNSSYAAMMISFVLIPLGMGVTVPAMVTMTLTTVDPGRAGISSALVNVARQLGSAAGVTFLGSVITFDAGSRLLPVAAISAGMLIGCALCALAIRDPAGHPGGRFIAGS